MSPIRSPSVFFIAFYPTYILSSADVATRSAYVLNDDSPKDSICISAANAYCSLSQRCIDGFGAKLSVQLTCSARISPIEYGHLN